MHTVYHVWLGGEVVRMLDLPSTGRQAATLSGTTLD